MDDNREAIKGVGKDLGCVGMLIFGGMLGIIMGLFAIADALRGVATAIGLHH